MEQELNLDQIRALPFTRIQRDGATPVPLATWMGWSSVAPAPHANYMARYFVDGNRLRARQDVSHDEGWYTLS
jgi:hypothetical protein